MFIIQIYVADFRMKSSVNFSKSASIFFFFLEFFLEMQVCTTVPLRTATV